jgi:exopolysaccharide biosynthesis polyprenyl glycosylphosphotransferase
MTVQVNNREATAVVTKNNRAILKNKKQGFQASFSARRVLLLLSDAFIVALAIVGAFLLWHQVAQTGLDVITQMRGQWYWFPVLLGGWLALTWVNDLYHTPVSFDKMVSITRVAVVGMVNLAVFLIGYLLIPDQLAWSLYLNFLAIVWPAITAWRIVYATVLARPNFKRRALIVGTGWTARTTAQTIKEHDPGCEIIGYVAGNMPAQERDIAGSSVLGQWDNLTALAQEHAVSDIVLAEPPEMNSGQLQAILNCFEQGVRIISMPQLFEEITGRIPIEHIGEHWLVFLPINWDSRRLYLIFKRAMDIVMSVMGLLLLAPFFPFLVLAIKLDSAGPIFYRPERLGQGGKPFRLWKFRTMVSNADCLGDPTFTQKNDQRITRLGRLLRLSHIDELGQFINILKGEMSVVGPRPERYLAELEENIPYYRTRYAVKPGATGWALVKQGYAEGLEGTLIKLQYDLYYIKHQSLSLDMLILCKSVIHMFTMRGR